VRNKPRLTVSIVAVAILGLVSISCAKKDAGNPTATTSSGGNSLVGAGATFPEPLYLKWIGDYKAVDSGAKINYQGIGSGGGVQQLIAQKVDFAGSDAFLKDDEIVAATKARKCAPLHIPTVFGSVAVAFNVKGVSALTLDGPTLANIFLKKVTTYNDPAIKALNPGVTLPATPIVVAHRSDESGTSKIFTTYLSEVSSEWKTKVGAGKSVQWPTGIGGQGNDGVASAVQQNPGGIGYVELAYALNNHLMMASLKNKDGKAIMPSEAATVAASKVITVPADLRFTVSNVGGDGYPIVGATWILAYECGYTAAKADALKKFLHWAISSGDAQAHALHYAPVSGDLQTKSLANVDKINSK